MMFEIFLILLVVALSCSLMGSLLLLNESLMIADAISHTILLGIVIAYYFTQNLSSPWLVFGATLFGVITVYSIRFLTMTGKVQMDAATGLIFPFFFSIAVIIISKFYGNVHLDIDMVLLGQVELAPLKRMQFLHVSLPVSFVQGVAVLFIICLFIMPFYKQIKICLFDETYARSIGLKVNLIHFIFMTLVSLTAVSSFESIGSILVIALMAAPAMTAYLLSKRFNTLLILALLIASLNSFIGYQIGIYYNTSISGMVAVVSFIIFMLVFFIKILVQKIHTKSSISIQ